MKVIFTIIVCLWNLSEIETRPAKSIEKLQASTLKELTQEGIILIPKEMTNAFKINVTGAYKKNNDPITVYLSNKQIDDDYECGMKLVGTHLTTVGSKSVPIANNYDTSCVDTRESHIFTVIMKGRKERNTVEVSFEANGCGFHYVGLCVINDFQKFDHIVLSKNIDLISTLTFDF